MEVSFCDALSALVATELAAARNSRDKNRGAEAVADLAEQLGIAIAIICDGDTLGVGRMLAGTEDLAATKAVETAGQLLKITHIFNNGGRR